MAQLQADRPERAGCVHGSGLTYTNKEEGYSYSGPPLIVCCFLWFDPKSPKPYQYDESYVHELKRRVEKNLSVPHEFVCISDRRIEGVKTLELDWTTFIPATRFAKLSLFRPDGPLKGRRVLYLDLDTVLVDSIDPIVDRKEDLVLWRNPNFGQKGRAFYNTSIMLHTVGTRPEFWERFNMQAVRQMYQATGWGGTDQAWISHLASRDEAHWTDADGVYGHGRLGDVAQGAGTKLPDNARIVFFPGGRTQRTPEVLAKSPWIKDYAA